MIANEWTMLQFKSASDVAWTGMASYPDFPAAIAKMLLASQTLPTFCVSVDAFDMMIMVYGMPTAITLPLSVINSDTALATEVTVMDNGETWYSVRDAGKWLFYCNDVIKRLSDPTDLAAFIS